MPLDGDYVEQELAGENLKDAKIKSIFGHFGPICSTTIAKETFAPFTGPQIFGLVEDHIFVNDQVEFKPYTHHGGHDFDNKGLRYLNWTYDPDPTDSSYISSMVYLARDESNRMIIQSDEYLNGLFDQNTWLRLFQSAVLKPKIIEISYKADRKLAILGKKE